MVTSNRLIADDGPDRKRSTRIEQVTEDLRRRIADGEWPIGTRIPAEPELCELLDASRNTVREAVGALVHAGVVERRQGSGTYVLAIDEHEVAIGDYFAAARRRDLIELREALEVTAADLAARRRDDDDIAILRETLARRNDMWNKPGELSSDERDAIVDVDTELHRAVVIASHNEVYLEFYDLLLPALRATIAARPVGPAKSFEEQHSRLVEAVIAGEPGRAAQAARTLLECVGADDA